MKLKSLILGSVAAVGLSTAGYAADLGVLTSLDVCDALGLSGLTISSETNCLQISGGVSYEFNWGNYKGKYIVTNTAADDFDNNNNQGPDASDVSAAAAATMGSYVDPTTGVATPYAFGAVLPAGATIVVPAKAAVPAGLDNDWESQLEAWLKFVGTADSDFGAAKAVIKLKSVTETRIQNEMEISSDDDTGAGATALNGNINTDKGLWKVDEAYVQVGDSTVIMAGKKSSIANFGDDEPFNFLGLFNSSEADTGVMFNKDKPKEGEISIQIVSDVGNGVKVGLGLENLDDGTAANAGTIVGVVSYAGENLSAHLTALAGGVLDGNIEDYAMHAGITGTFDAFKVRGAFAANHNNAANLTYWNGLLSAQGTFDMFTIALSGEFAGATARNTDYGIGGSVGATVTDGVKINLGGRYYNSNNGAGFDGYQVAAQLVAAVTETLTATGEIGVYGTNNPVPNPGNTSQTDFYGSAQLAWAPGGGFTSSLKGEAHQNGAYKVTFKAAKSFE
ncbi:hypothetical protein PSQ19_01800 [Devosia algicola]|uniref:Porin n=1 Tax=Devosia algicola TaxID=3026418 RepID=A0ABY7YP54_9HYPH|nr:hypothetical protein [Devosia algicola]WDR02977.1 hypothetical protein PSQ19_01800 [Devosia algicola]